VYAWQRVVMHGKTPARQRSAQSLAAAAAAAATEDHQLRR